MFQLRVRKPVVLEESQKSAVEGLQAAMTRMAPRDTEFAGSLVSNFYKWGRLSDKQMQWVDTLTQRVQAPKPQQVAAERLNFQPIQDLFDRAGQRLRRVKVKLQAADATPVVFARAGTSSKYAGQIMITDGGAYGEGRWFGRIDTNGDFYPTAKATPEVQALVREFSENPALCAARYGKLTGGCSFCNHGLKDERSTRVGYGPICAENFGLPWGAR